MIKLRQFAAGDESLCHDIYRDAVHNGTSPHYTAEEAEAWAPSGGKPDVDAWSTRLANQFTWIAVSGEKGVGFASVSGDGYIDMFFVRPEARPLGAARLLYGQLVLDARNAGAERLSTHASHLFRSFLLKRGWHVVEKEHVPRHGSVLTRFVMARDDLPD